MLMSEVLETETGRKALQKGAGRCSLEYDNVKACCTGTIYNLW
jgi:hypothetical protein